MIAATAQQPKFSKNQVINYIKLNRLMIVTHVAFHKYLKKYYYTLATEDLQPLIKLIPETDLEPWEN